MGLGFTSWFLLQLALLAMCIHHGNGTRDDEANGAHVHHHSSHMDHMDTSLFVFFTLNDLKVGKSIPIYFPKRDPATSPHFLPREEADSIPFSSKQLNSLLEKLSYSQDSPQAKAMENTLALCESDPILGETKFCATSFESMLDFARVVFGLDTPLNVLTTTHLTESTTLFQNYTVMAAPQEIVAPKIVSCHSMSYPYAVFFCHALENQTKVFKVNLGGDDGDLVDAVAVCHMDTSLWSPDHVWLRLLGVQPGAHVCHFFPADHFVCVPSISLN